jgi:hypothetical protein
MYNVTLKPIIVLKCTVGIRWFIGGVVGVTIVIIGVSGTWRGWTGYVYCSFLLESIAVTRINFSTCRVLINPVTPRLEKKILN